MAVAAPPAAVEAERNLLAALTLNQDALSAALTLHAEDFADHRHATIFEAAVALAAAGTPVDQTTLRAKLSAAGREDVGRYLVELCATTDGLASRAATYAEIVAEGARKARMRSAAVEAVAQIDQGVDPAVAFASMAQAAVAGTTSTVVDMVSAQDRVLAMLETDSSTNRLPTSLPDLDRILSGGLLPGQLVLCGARPSMGKSAWAAGCALATAQAGHPVLFVTVEMTVEEIMVRWIAKLSGISVEQMSGSHGAESFSKGEWMKMGEALAALEKLPIHFIEGSATVAEIRSRVQARRMAGHDPYKLVVVDYLQLLTPPRRDSRNEAVAEMSRELKVMAGGEKVAVLSLSQLSRNLEQRADKRPILADLRDSGSLEQDADVVVFLYRPSVYDPNDQPGLAELIVAKQRQGRLGTAVATFLEERTAFVPAAARI